MKTREYHGHAHKGAVSPEYRAWQNMNKRCYDTKHKDYKHYGGRGISVCSVWRKSFDAFLAYIGYRPSAKHTVERIDNDKGYKYGNVKWATRAEQSRNRRVNIKITRNGVTKTLIDWVAETDLDYTAVLDRLDRGWDAERALTTPSRPKRKAHKLTIRDVRQIRRLHASGKYTQVELARRFGLANHSVIGGIVLGRTWKGVN